MCCCSTAPATLPTVLLDQIFNKSPINFFGPKSRSSKYRLPAPNFPNKFRVTKFYEILAALPLNSRILYFTCKSKLHFVKKIGVSRPVSHHRRLLTFRAASLPGKTVVTGGGGHILSSWAAGEGRRGQLGASYFVNPPLTSYFPSLIKSSV